MTTPVLRGERLVLDRFRPDDAPTVFAICQDADIQQFTRVPVPYSLQDAAEFVGSYADSADGAGDVSLWAIRRADELLGSIELRILTPGVAEIGFLLAAEHRGEGLMTEAVRLVAGYGFASDGPALRRIVWKAAVGNTASAGVARRAGFTYTGIRASSVDIRGALHDGWTAELGPETAVVSEWPT